jgi:hypothetical protein
MTLILNVKQLFHEVFEQLIIKSQNEHSSDQNITEVKVCVRPSDQCLSNVNPLREEHV